ncbi:hypothetical protein ERO13_D08G157800v2 [Gossypium hirsutum]|uniref:Signal peptidase complex catalytic subunit SEC11A n=2 Tax=Gossypium TaxID=3633 RepID=A0ABM3AHF4_GOSHI|nr:signal peptidase complex catalytic subunit SEC11A-like [Gossypium hirsutum]KAG4134462.1 hypothetical protein ERO13_D08G157800v2 [Gossypium hirsutum]
MYFQADGMLNEAEIPKVTKALEVSVDILYCREKYSNGMVISSALIIWKGLICIIGSKSPVVVVLFGSMEPGFKRVHEQRNSKEADILTKGDANLYDDRMLYNLVIVGCKKKYIMGRAVGKDPIMFTYAYLRACRSQICGSNSKPCSKVFL